MGLFTFSDDKAQGVPAGAYQGKYLGYREAETKNGPTLVWEWYIMGGTEAGKTAVAYTDPPSKTKPTPKNHLGVILAGLAGKACVGGDSFDPMAVVGNNYTIVVAPGPKGGACQVRQISPPMQ